MDSKYHAQMYTWARIKYILSNLKSRKQFENFKQIKSSHKIDFKLVVKHVPDSRSNQIQDFSPIMFLLHEMIVILSDPYPFSSYFCTNQIDFYSSLTQSTQSLFLLLFYVFLVLSR